MKTFLLASLSLFWISSDALSQTDSIESICPAPITDAPLNGGVSNAGGTLRFMIGTKEIVTCDGSDYVNIINITDNNTNKVRCVHMKNEADGGKGFAPESYDIAHLWLYVSKKEDPDLVQIGIYDKGEKLSWIVTDYYCK